MLGFALSELFLRLLSAILGGYGIFCLIMSFAVPALGAQDRCGGGIRTTRVSPRYKAGATGLFSSDP
jgi:hypothetical protein